MHVTWRTDSYEKLKAFWRFAPQDEYAVPGHPVSDYYIWVDAYLEEKYRLTSKQATMEQLEEAARYAAKKWRETSGEI